MNIEDVRALQSGNMVLIEHSSLDSPIVVTIRGIRVFVTEHAIYDMDKWTVRIDAEYFGSFNLHPYQIIKKLR